MAYTSPISLLSEQQRALMPATDLKKVRNELLLHFQFSSEPVVEINGQEYDKDAVVQLMDQLQAKPNLHWTIYQNEAVRLILETGNLSLFNRFKALQQIDEHPEVAGDIHALLAETINEELPEKILEFNSDTTALLSVLKFYTDKLSDEDRAVAYSESFRTMDLFLTNIKERFPVPYLAPGNYTFHPEMQHILKREVLNMFKQLPPEFQPCLHKLGTFCNNQVVMPFVEKEAEVKSWPRDSLAMVIEAAVIASEIFNRDGNLKIANNIHDYLTKKKESSPFRIILFIILAIVFLFRIARACNRSDNSSSHYSSRDNTYTISNDELREVLEKQGYHVGREEPSSAEARRLNGSATEANDLVSFAGEKWNAKTNTLTIRYDAEVLPTASGFFSKYVSNDIMQKYPSDSMKIDLSFSKKGLPGVVMRHFLKRNDQAKAELIKGRFTSDTSRSDIKVIPLRHVKRYKGYATLMDMTGNVLDRDTLGLKIRPGTEYIDLVYNGLTESERPKGSYQNMDAFSLRGRCFLNNLRRLENQTLTKSTSTPISDLWLYDFRSNAHPDTVALQHSVMDGTNTIERNLVYSFTSAADGIAYFEIDRGTFNIRYMIQSATGEIIGCQMIQVSKHANRVERMELFLTKK